MPLSSVSLADLSSRTNPMILDWNEVKRKKIMPQNFTIKNMHKRLSERCGFFKPVLDNKQSLRNAIEEARKLFEKSKAGRGKR